MRILFTVIFYSVPKSRLKIGGRYGRYTTLRFTNPNSARHVECVCDCGQIKIVQSAFLLDNERRGIESSCACLKNEKSAQRCRTHGLSHMPEYTRWSRMRARCVNPTLPEYPYYGGRGIKTHPSWGSFGQFLDDMGPMPGPEYTIERRDVTKDYCPENCYWLVGSQQQWNKSNTRYTSDGVSFAKIAGENGWPSGRVSSMSKYDITSVQVVDYFTNAPYDCRSLPYWFRKFRGVNISLRPKETRASLA